jgi:polyhydroxybutyrate depolymerase
MRFRILALATLVACGDDGTAGTPDAPASIEDAAIDAAAGPDARDTTLVDARPYELRVPTGYVAGTPTPLVVLLHGYGASGSIQEQYFKFAPVAEANTWLYAIPDGTKDANNRQFWAATNACCGSGVDDVAYLTAVIDDVAAQYSVDPKRVYLLGHSNGGFMAHRMACDRADRIAAIVSLAGATWNDAAQCVPTGPVAVAQVHGTMDETILYGGGTAFGVYPSAMTTFSRWSTLNSCTGTAERTTLDLVTALAGNETRVEAAQTCTAGGASELWTIEGGTHIPALTPAFVDAVGEFFAAHAKP